MSSRTSSRTSSKTNSRTNASANASASDATIPKNIFNDLEDIKYELIEICDRYMKNNSDYFNQHVEKYTSIHDSEFYVKTVAYSTTNNLNSNDEVSKRIKLCLYRFRALVKMCKSIHYILNIFLDFITVLLANKKYLFAESDDIRNIITKLKLTKKESFSKIRSFFSKKSAVKRRNSVRTKKMNNVNTLDKDRIHKERLAASTRTRHTNVAHQNITTPNNNTQKVNAFLQKKNT
jgi:type III secretory pathway component EscR